MKTAMQHLKFFMGVEYGEQKRNYELCNCPILMPKQELLPQRKDTTPAEATRATKSLPSTNVNRCTKLKQHS